MLDGDPGVQKLFHKAWKKINNSKNVVGLKNADSAEFKDTKEDFCHIITDMPEHNTGIMGGTMRLGKRKTFFLKEKRAYSVLYHLYKRKDVIEERHRHRFEVNKEYVEKIEREGMCFVGKYFLF
ncbi:hypothetical protein PGB90_001371 [Kerria lacca]